MVNHRGLFRPIYIGSVEIKNRVALAPMGNFSMTKLDGSFSDEAIAYFRERARGGVGLIITGLCKVENDVEPVPLNILPLITPGAFASLAELAEEVHAFDAKLFVQLTAGFGRVGHPRMLSKPPVAPSAIPNYWVPSVTCREVTTSEVEHYVRSFGIAAAIVAEAGADGVEIHAVHEGYFLDQFTIAMFNHRSDKYGGDLRGRLTFPTEIVREIKQKTSDHFPVSLRFSVKSFIKDWRQGAVPGEQFEEKGRDIDEGLKAAAILEQAGYDALNADCGSYDAWYWAHPPTYQEHGALVPYVEKLKSVVKIPVLAAGRLEIPDLAESVLAGHKADMVVLGRGLLADPYWVQKVEAGLETRIRPCIGCHDGCLGRGFEGKPLCCAVNPAVGREESYRLQPAVEKKRILIVGGGIAGLEAARVAAERGHNVTLYEKSDALGGHLIEASVPRFKKDLVKLLDWYRNELRLLKVDIRLRVEVTPSIVDAEKPDVTIIATGSRPRMPKVPGVDRKNVMTDVDLLLRKESPGQNIVVIGGGMIGCETALWLVQQGKEVTVVDELDELMSAGMEPIPHANRTMLLDLLKFNKVRVITNHHLAEIADDGITLEAHDFHREKIPADTIAISIGLSSNRELYDSIEGQVPEVHVLGDARQVRNVMGAVWDAYEVARAI